MLKQINNEALFHLYDKELVLRLHNTKNLSDTRKILSKFKDYLGNHPPSTELAKGFLAQYTGKKPRTLYRYTQMIRMLMKWYGEPLEDFKVRVPKSLPPYTEDNDIDKLLQAVASKTTHKKTIERDSLLIRLALKSGMRRGELSNLEVRDIHGDFLIIRRGKYEKDRTIPLTADMATQLSNFNRGKKPEDKVFNLIGPSITMKIKKFARRAGLIDLHAHTLRHKFATDLLEKGADIKTVQQLMGHENLNTTQVYLSITDKRLREAVNLLDEHKESTIAGKIQTVDRLLETAAEVTLQPLSPQSDNWKSSVIPDVCQPLRLTVEGDQISIVSIRVRSSDLRVPYRLLMFEVEPPADPLEWDREDILQLTEVRQRVFTYAPNAAIQYSCGKEHHQLYAGISIGHRPIRFDIPNDDEQKMRAYYDASVDYIISVRYRLSS